MFASLTSISMELFIMPLHHHHPFAADGSIPSNHLHNIEHATISLTFFTYAFFAVVLDKLAPPAKTSLTHLLAILTLAQEFLLFCLHSTDHAGLEGHYHWLLQLIIFTSVAVADTRSFLISFVRSLAVFAQGVFGFMLYTLRLMPKGCTVGVEDGHYVVQCNVGEAVVRAKSLANILFSYYVVLVLVFGMVVYLRIVKLYSKDQVEYHSLKTDAFEDKKEEEGDTFSCK